MHGRTLNHTHKWTSPVTYVIIVASEINKQLTSAQRFLARYNRETGQKTDGI